MEEELRSAVQNRLVISYSLLGHSRTGEPHLLGYMDGGLALELFQTSGGSTRGGIPEWRTFYISDMSDLAVSNETFVPRSDFNPGRSRWDPIVASVR